MRISVPGNLLLLGEYAVMEEGGLGLALAVEKRLHLELRPAPPGQGPGGGEALVVEGRWGGGGLHWNSTSPDSSPLIRAVVETCREAAGTLPGQAEVSIDSGAFFSEGGQKSGYGSSAAVAVALSWALLAWAGLPSSELEAAVLDAALRGHRLAQGGVGSGYDVFACCRGGVGLFTGGRRPSWQPLELPWLRPLCVFRGAGSVATPGAARRYGAWKAAAPRETRRFLRRSNRYVRRFLAARSWEQASEWFDALADLGLRLGEAIGVPARIQPPPALADRACKALGAGNELGVALLAPGQGARAGCEPVEISRRGVLWQP